jgi:capsular exopolysaccharide synthesis family protein
MKNNQDENEFRILLQEESFSKREFWEFHWLHRKWIFISIIFFGIAGFVFVNFQSPLSTYKALILIKDPATRQAEMALFSDQSSRRLNSRTGYRSTSRTAYSTQSFVENEALVIHSGMLMERLAMQLNLHTTYATRSGLHQQEIFRDAPYEVKLDSAALYRLEDELKLTVQKHGDLIRIRGEYLQTEFDIEVAHLPVVLKTSAGLVSINALTGNSYSNKKIYIRIVHPETVVRRLLEHEIKTEINKNSDDIALFYNTGNPAKGREVLKTLIELYNIQAIEQSNQTAVNTGIFLRERIAILSGELGKAESEIQQFKQLNEIFDFPEHTRLFIQGQADYYNNLVNVDLQLQQTDYISEYLRKDVLLKQLIPMSKEIPAGLAMVISGYNQLVLKRNQLLEGTSDNNPALLKVNRQLESTKKAIQEQLIAMRKSLQIQWDKQWKENRYQKQKLSALPEQEKDYLSIKRQQLVKEGIYTYLLKKKEETELSLAAVSNQARVLNAPMLHQRISPNIPLTMGIFLLAGLLIPVSALHLRRFFNHQVTNRKEVEMITPVPVISELTHQDSQDSFVDHNSSIDSNAELLRLLRNKVQMALMDTQSKVILVSSTQPGEGKTFVSLNLAISFSLTGKKVLLMGMDLRKPMLASHFGIRAKEGISSFLAGTTSDIAKLIHQVKKQPHLHVMPGGIIPPNPNELIGGERLEQLIEQLKSQYDYIIVDSAPVGVVSDTFLLSRIAHMTLYIARANYSDKRNIAFLNRIWQEQSLKNLYLVINDVSLHATKYGYS